MSYSHGPGQGVRQPAPPTNPEHRSRIEDVARYVASNGPNSEEATRRERAGDRCFEFLLPGGEFHDYYLFCLQGEIVRLHATPSVSSGPPQQLMPVRVAPLTNGVDRIVPPEIRDIEARLHRLRADMQQSEGNLSAHYESMQQQAESIIPSRVELSEKHKIAGILQRISLDVSTFEPLIEELCLKCSKDAISKCKHWILDNCPTDQLREAILTYLLSRCKASSSGFEFRLHLLYLVNDWAHHVQRKKLDAERQMLSRYVPKLYAYTHSKAADEPSLGKLEKLVSVWEKQNYFDDNCFKQLRNPPGVLHTLEQIDFAERKAVEAQVRAEMMQTYKQFEHQHHEYVAHTMRAMVDLENRLSHWEYEQRIQHEEGSGPNQGIRPRRSRFDCGPPPSHPPSLLDVQVEPISTGPPPPPAQPVPVPSLFDPNGPAPSYWQLPAGAMLPFLSGESFAYDALPTRGMQPTASFVPSDRLLAALQSFYHSQKATNDLGWELNGLGEFMEAKASFRKEFEERMQSENKTFEEMVTNKPSQNELDEESDRRMKEYREKLKTGKSVKRQTRSRSSSSSSSSSSGSSGSNSSSSSSSSGSRSSSKKRTRRKSSRPAESAAGQRQFVAPTFIPSTSAALPNRGAALMARMGWQGKGLGANEQGSATPVSDQIEVRTPQNALRGLGSDAVSDDPFDSFRRQSAGRYYDRAQLRDDTLKTRPPIE